MVLILSQIAVHAHRERIVVVDLHILHLAPAEPMVCALVDKFPLAARLAMLVGFALKQG